MRYDVGRFRRPMRRSTEGQLASLVSLGDGSTLTLDFTTGILDPRLSFERLSPATFINSGGSVEWAAANMMTRSQSQDVNAYWNAFGTSVTRTGSQTDPFGGSGAVKLNYDATSADAVISRTVSVQQGLQYTISVWLRADSGTVNNVRFGRGASAAGAYFPSLTTTWQRFSLTFTATGGSDGMELRVLTSGTPKTASFHVFGAQLEPGGTMRDYNPALLDVPYHAPRFDHDPTTLAPRGLLIEGQATNAVTYSNDFSNAAWLLDNSGATNPSVSTVSQTGPDGAATVARITLNKTGGTFSRIRNTASGTASQPYTMSVWMKANTASGGAATQNVGLRIGGDPAGFNCVVTTTWKRFQYTYTLSSTDANAQIILWDNIVGNDETADVLVYGCQMEAGSFASSYIPTVSSTATRSQDTATMAITSADLGFDNNRYTVRIRGKQNTFGVSFARSARFFAASTEPIGFAVNSATFYPVSGNTSGSNIAILTIANSLNQDFRLAWSMDADLATGTMLGSRNQSASSVNRSNTGPTANITGFGLNTNTAATAYASMTIRDIKFWPMMMNAAQLNALTAP